MRDPKRIDAFLESFKEVWLAHPDLRLSQLILNVASESRIGLAQLFNLEDDKLLELLQDFHKKNPDVGN